MSDEPMEAEWLLEADWGTAEVRRPPRRTYSFTRRDAVGDVVEALQLQAKTLEAALAERRDLLPTEYERSELRCPALHDWQVMNLLDDVRANPGEDFSINGEAWPHGKPSDPSWHDQWHELRRLDIEGGYPGGDRLNIFGGIGDRYYFYDDGGWDFVGRISSRKAARAEAARQYF